MARKKKNRIKPISQRENTSSTPETCDACVKTPISSVFKDRTLHMLRAVGKISKYVISKTQATLRRMQAQRAQKFLRVRETASLGEKRFLAVVEAGDQTFLIGGAASSLTMLACLKSEERVENQFSSILRRFEERDMRIQ